MDDFTSPTALSSAAGISVPYASQILSGTRVPSQRTAIRIYRQTGVKLGPISQASEGDIEMLSRLLGLAA